MELKDKIKTLMMIQDSLAKAKWYKFQHSQFCELRSNWNQLQEISDPRIVGKPIESETYRFDSERIKSA